MYSMKENVFITGMIYAWEWSSVRHGSKEWEVASVGKRWRRKMTERKDFLWNWVAWKGFEEVSLAREPETRTCDCETPSTIFYLYCETIDEALINRGMFELPRVNHWSLPTESNNAWVGLTLVSLAPNAAWNMSAAANVTQMQGWVSPIKYPTLPATQLW